MNGNWDFPYILKPDRSMFKKIQNIQTASVVLWERYGQFIHKVDCISLGTASTCSSQILKWEWRKTETKMSWQCLYTFYTTPTFYTHRARMCQEVVLYINAHREHTKTLRCFKTKQIQTHRPATSSSHSTDPLQGWSKCSLHSSALLFFWPLGWASFKPENLSDHWP